MQHKIQKLPDESRKMNGIKQIIKPHILRGQSGDWKHAKRVARWVKELGNGRTDLQLLLVAAYLHDIVWKDLAGKDKLTFEQLLELEPRANANSKKNIIDFLEDFSFSQQDINTVLRLVHAADNHQSEYEDEEILVDADSLSKLEINHLKDKFQSSEWMKMHELWCNEFPQRIKTQYARQLFPHLLEKLEEEILKTLT